MTLYFDLATMQFPQFILLERALPALASSSGGTACPGVPGVNPGDRPQESGADVHRCYEFFQWDARA